MVCVRSMYNLFIHKGINAGEQEWVVECILP